MTVKARPFWKEPDGELAFGPGQNRIRINYNFIPGARYGSSANLFQLESNEIMITDNIISRSRSPHTVGVPGWNVLKVDGSVKFTRSKSVFAKLHNYSATDLGNWGKFDIVTEPLTK